MPSSGSGVSDRGRAGLLLAQGAAPAISSRVFKLIKNDH